MCSHSPACRLGGPRSSEFDTSSPFLPLFLSFVLALPLPIPHIGRLPPQQPNLALNRIVPSDNVSRAQISTWVASEDWMLGSWVWRSLSAGEGDDDAAADVVDNNSSGRSWF